MTGRAVGILGGTFDPVHRGHLALAASARRTLGLELVLLLPCSIPPHKPGRRVTPAYERLEMLYLAAEDRGGLRIATDEIAQGGVVYTIDTLRALRGRGLSPVFLLGSDALAEIDTWREHRALLAEFDLAAVVRSREDGAAPDRDWPEDARARVALVPLGDDLPPLGAGGRIVLLPVVLPAVSSRLVRARTAEGLPVRDLVPARVDRYIQRRGLYRQEVSR